MMTLRLLVKIGLGLMALALVGFVLLLGYVLYQQRAYRKLADTRDLRKRVANMGEKYVAKRPNAGLVIGVLQRGNRYVQGFGRVNSTSTNPPNGETIFEIGSVTKVFTGITLARMANAGLFKLDDPIARHLPGEVVCPKKNNHQITLLHLATHTSGLPRLPDNFNATVKDEQNPYVTYKASDLYKDLATAKLSCEPGSKSDYSNYGFGLLGHILELASHKSYEEAVKEAICAPLGMSNTVMHLTSEQKGRLTPGHNPKGAPVPNWDFDVLAGCGAFRSTVDDMIAFVEANLKDNDSEIGKALAEAQKFHFKQFSGGVGLGWQIDEPVEERIVHWHNGGTGGYVSFIGFDKPAQVGVVILSNYGDAWANDHTVDEMGMKILKEAPKISWE